MFEEEYKKVVDEMRTLLDDKAYCEYIDKWEAACVHQGYFSQDKTGQMKDTNENREEGRENALRAYDLIMKNKERLLSFEEPVRFIFSHSALKEGWDNPNVFQICTLKETDNETRKRQEVGRGMRLCVNKDGIRQDETVLGTEGVFDTNILTVIASESYDSFAAALQKEIAENISDRPMVITSELFAKTVLIDKETRASTEVTKDQALEIYEQLVKHNYVVKGKLSDTYYIDKQNGVFTLGEELQDVEAHVVSLLDKVFNPKSIEIENARKPKEARFKEEAFNKKAFQELWKRINVKTYYKVDFESKELITKSIDAINKHLNVSEIRIIVENGSLENIRDKESLENGTAMIAGSTQTMRVSESVGGGVTYDFIGQIVENTGLTRRTVVEILKGIASATFLQFQKNPEEFIVKVSNIINDEKAMAVVQKIAYEKTSNTYDVDIFTENSVRGKIGINVIESVKSLYDLVVVDSMGVEKKFAEELEKHDEVEVYTKLPRGFYINTPMGKYNPDWAVCFREGTVKHIYFIAETKGNDWQRSQLRGAEECKLECAARHFEAINQNKDVVYGVVKDYTTLLNKVLK